MALGFPAYHTRTYQLKAPAGLNMDVIQSALVSLQWPITQREHQAITASVGTSWLSWGESIRIEMVDPTTVRLTSQCVAPTQCFDWGKNKSNVKTLVAQIQKTEASQPTKPPPLPL